MRARSRRTAFVTASLALLSGGASFAAAEDAATTDHAQHQGPAGHQMTHEQIEILKSKIEIYRPYTDEQINAAMSRMYEAQEYLSLPAVRNEIGILGLGHGYKAEGDALFKRGYAGVAAVYPTEVGDNTSLIRQWNYAFGLSDESSYLDVPRIRSQARIMVSRTPTTSPLVTQILADYVRGASRNPAGEVVVMIAHGPEDAADNEKELANLAVHATGIKAATGVAEVMYGTLQDDAPPAIRQKNVDRMRGWVAGAMASGRKVIVVPVVIVSRSGVSARIAKDLSGLDYVSTEKGIAEHMLFDQWIRDTLAAATKPAGTG